MLNQYASHASGPTKTGPVIDGQFDIGKNKVNTLNCLLVKFTATEFGPLLLSELPLILCCADSTRCRNIPQRGILLHIDVTASHRCCRCIGCTSMI